MTRPGLTASISNSGGAARPSPSPGIPARMCNLHPWVSWDRLFLIVRTPSTSSSSWIGMSTARNNRTWILHSAQWQKMEERPLLTVLLYHLELGLFRIRITSGTIKPVSRSRTGPRRWTRSGSSSGLWNMWVSYVVTLFGRHFFSSSSPPIVLFLLGIAQWDWRKTTK
jgi:hypothetical protein